MKTAIAVALFCKLLLLPAIVAGQDQIPTYVFSISAGMARQLYQHPKDTIDISLLTSPVDSFFSAKEEQVRTSGHYLYVRPSLENLDIQLRSYYRSRVEVQNNDRDLALEVIDAAGNSRADARVWLKKKQIPYDEASRTYRLKRHAGGGFLQVAIDQDTLFYDLNSDTRGPVFFRRIEYWRRGTAGYIVTTPIRWLENSYRYLNRGIRWGDWGMRSHPFWFLQREAGFKGYVLLNQPKYRPGDTLRVKAYLAAGKGKPWSHPARLQIYAWQGYRSGSAYLVDTLLQPVDEAGNFVFDWPLADSLLLDLDYQLYFRHPRRARFESLSHHFRLEDYELDEATFQLQMANTLVHRGEKIALQAEGKDQNGQWVAGAEVKLVLLTQAINAIYRDSLSIPDTLWTSREQLGEREATQLLIPDSIFPPADLELKLIANFMEASGALQQKEQIFQYRYQWEELILKLQGDSILMDYQIEGQSQQKMATVTRYGIQSNELPHYPTVVSLPHREAFSPFIEQYQLRVGDLEQRFDPKQEVKGPVLVQGSWQPDTLTISYQNSHLLAINWLLQTGNRELQRGLFAGPSGVLKIPVSNQRHWTLRYNYHWYHPIEEALEIYRFDKQLQLQIEQPARIQPGETVPVRIRVEDAYGRPAAGVHLAGAGINTQFGNAEQAFLQPSIPYKTRRKPFVIDNFSPDILENITRPSQRMDARWYRLLRLQPYAFYQMRYQNPGLWMLRHTLTADTFYQQLAQVSPYLIRNHRSEPVYLIYINHELVYYAGSVDAPRYSFVGQPGYNRISMRTRTAEYTLDSVWLGKGQKLELAIDPDHFQNGIEHLRLHRRSMPPYWTSAEEFMLGTRLLALDPKHRSGEQYFWDSPTNIHRLMLTGYRYQPVLLGPFRDKTEVYHVLRGQWDKKMIFEPGYTYDIEAGRERLYEWKFWQSKGKKQLGVASPPQRPGQLVYRPEDVRRELEEVQQIHFDYAPKDRQSGLARIRFLHTPVNEQDLAVVLQSAKGTEWVFPVQTNLTGQLTAGSYQLFLVRTDGRVKKWQISLQPNSTFALDLSAADYVPDSLRQWPERLYSHTQVRTVDREGAPSPARSRTNNPYTGRGRLLRGRLTDDNGEPLIGASILIKGTSVGTLTDFDGNYAIWIPEGDPELTFSYVGFNTQELGFRGHSTGDVVLAPSAVALEEVVVTSLGTRNVRQIATTQTTLAGIANGVDIKYKGRQIHIRGSRTIAGAQPLIYIDGRLSTLEELALIAPGDIDQLSQLSGADATTIYGANAASGVYLITTRSNQSILPQLVVDDEPAISMREQFRDYAFWQPYLLTDKKGEAYFQATFPDNITAWNTYVLAMDRRQRAGIGQARTQAWKSLVARLSLPRFMVTGDEAEVMGQAVNYSSDSLTIHTFFRQGEQELYRKEHRLGASLSENYRLVADTGADSLSLSYGLQNGDYLDGEKRDIPVFPSGSLETEGYFAVLSGDTTVQWSFSQEGPVTVFAAGNNLELLLDDLDFLRNFPYDCMEQTASRLIALSLEKQVRQYAKVSFDGENQLRRMIRRLENGQGPDGGWGWWPGSETSVWITVHALKALHMALPPAAEFESLELGVRFLIHKLPGLTRKEQLLVLDLLAELGQAADYEHYLTPIDSSTQSLYDRLLITRIRQRMELPYQLDTLDKHRQQTLYGAYFWGEQEAAPLFYRRLDHPIATTLLAYELLRDAGRREEAERVQQYFLEMRGIGQPQTFHAWYNTYETARVLATILPDLIKKGEPLKSNQLTIRSDGQQFVADHFPWQQQLATAGGLSLEKKGTGPLYLTAYRRFHNPKPEVKADIFEISTRIIQKEKEVTALQTGELAELEVTLYSRDQAEYVMLEVPIPAACSYGDRQEKRNALEDHREYDREKVVIFCAALPEGKHTFRIALEPRFSGSFTLNPARAEQMYFPVFYGRNELKKLEVR